MATTNYRLAEIMKRESPNSFSSIQDLVSVMAKCYNSHGKKTIGGEDKFDKNFELFKTQFFETIRAMRLNSRTYSWIKLRSPLTL